MVFKSEVELKAFLLPKIKNAVADVEKEVYATIKSTLAEFYSEFTPEEYIRTNQLLHSLVKTGIISTGDGFEAKVYFDVGMLNYITGSWDGQTVLDVSMGGSHGGYVGGTPVWSASLEKLGNIKGKLIQALIAQGIPIV